MNQLRPLNTLLLLLLYVTYASAGATRDVAAENVTRNATENITKATIDASDSLLEGKIQSLRSLPQTIQRIVGGNTVTPGAFPFFAQWMKGCGGSLIHDDVVLTAGHCLIDKSDLNFEVFIGGHESATGQRRQILSHVFHPRFDNDNNKAYDFLLLKLDRPVDNPTLIQLNPDPQYPSATSNELFQVIGFGHTSEDGQNADYLQQVTVPHIPNCQPYYGNRVNPDIAFCSGHQLGGKDSCQADSGGALFHPETHIQIGMVSWGRGCARRNAPGVYARVSAAYSWIHHQVCTISAMPPAHCVSLRIELTHTSYPEETEWALLDSYGQEMVFYPRGSIQANGLTTVHLSVPAGAFRLMYYGVGGVAIINQVTNESYLSRSGNTLRDVFLKFTIESPMVANSTTTSSSKATPILTVAPNSAPTTEMPRLNTLPPAISSTILDTTAPLASPTPTALSTNQLDKVVQVSSTPSDISVPSWITGGGVVTSSNINVNNLHLIRTSLRVEIFYDMHPEETGWFLVHKDTNDELYASKYDSNNRISANRDKALSLEVEEFEELQFGDYWFVIADTGENGICCEKGEGYVKIVQVLFFESSVPSIDVQVDTTTISTTMPAEEERDDWSTVILEEQILWQHKGNFHAYAEAHFSL